MKELRLAERLYDEGRLLEAESALKRVLLQQPEAVGPRVMLAVICARTRRGEEAEKRFESILREVPDQVDSLVWLVKIKIAKRDYQDAFPLSMRAMEAAPNSSATHNAYGTCCLATRRTDEALASFLKAIELEPEAAAAHHNLGLAYRIKSDTSQACKCFKRAIELAPQRSISYTELFSEFSLLFAWKDAVDALEKGVRNLPHSASLWELLGYSHSKAGNAAKADEAFSTAWNLQPGHCLYHATCLQEQGRFAESVDLAIRSIATQKHQGAAYYCLTEAKTFEFGDQPLIEKAMEIFPDPAIRGSERMFLNYALARAHDREKNYSAAMLHFDEANRAAYENYNEGRQLDTELMDRNYAYITGHYSRETFDQWASAGSSSDAPIFIIGMIRSGTTLLDQIISSHSDVGSAGELNYWRLEDVAIRRQWDARGFRPTDITQVSDRYLPVLRSQVGNLPRIIDKMPLNFQHLGLIHSAFPKAKILHIRRDPMDTCFSIYSTHFGPGPTFAYHQKNIANFYRGYLKVMDHWRHNLPDDIFMELDYEQLVYDREQTVRNALEFLALPWESGCMQHEQNHQAVASPSRWQVRQPIYSSSVGRWKNYEPYLGDLLDLKGIEHPSQGGFLPVDANHHTSH